MHNCNIGDIIPFDIMPHSRTGATTKLVPIMSTASEPSTILKFVHEEFGWRRVEYPGDHDWYTKGLESHRNYILNLADRRVGEEGTE